MCSNSEATNIKLYYCSDKLALTTQISQFTVYNVTCFFFSYSTAYDQDRCDITALAVQGGVVWLGTRNGYLLLLDAAVMEEGGDPLLGLQYCGEGKVRCIIPLSPHKGLTKSLQVRKIIIT